MKVKIAQLTQTKFPGARLQNNFIGAKGVLQLLSHFQGSIRTGVINYNDFKVKFTIVIKNEKRAKLVV